VTARGARATPAGESRRQELVDLAKLFLRLGATAFGGPAAHIAMMEDQVVTRRKWLTRERFLDMIGVTNLIPGPNSTEMAIHVGHARAGLPGLVVAGASFIAPAVLLVLAIAWAYVRYGSLPQAAGILYGVKPVVIAVVLQALWRLGGSALKSPRLIGIAAGAAALAFLRVNELVVLLVAGLAAAVGSVSARRLRSTLARHCPTVLPLAAANGGAAVAASFGLWPMFLFFLKVGSVLFGSGYVLIAFLRADLVERWHWLTPGQLLDAVAVGQVTPGPVFTTATFIGYLLAGPKGALLATVGIFVPAFFFVAVSGLVLPRLRRSPVASAVLDGVNAGSLALMAVVTFELGRSALVDLPSVGLAAASAFLLLRLQVNSAWLVAGGAVVGLAIRLFGGVG
jgi:chromate transporter